MRDAPRELLGILKKIDKLDNVAKENPELQEICQDKLKHAVEQYETVSNMENMREAQRGAAEIMQMCDDWLQSSKYLLGDE